MTRDELIAALKAVPENVEVYRGNDDVLLRVVPITEVTIFKSVKSIIVLE